MPDLSVVIVSYNTRDLLRDCLRSLRESDGLALEVIVVDNNSSDGSARMTREAFPEAILLHQARNSWYCGGNNIGIARASAEYVLLLNPDTQVAPDALRRMRDWLTRHPDYAAVTAQMTYPEGGIQQTCSRIPSYFSLLLSYSALGYLLRRTRKRMLDHLFYADWDRQSDRDVKVTPGSCTMMRRAEIWLDGDLLLYFPEVSLAAAHGRLSYFLAGARITHHEKSSTRSFAATRIYYRDLLVYCRKRHGKARAGLLWLLSRPVFWLMCLKQRVASPGR